MLLQIPCTVSMSSASQTDSKAAAHCSSFNLLLLFLLAVAHIWYPSNPFPRDEQASGTLPAGHGGQVEPCAAATHRDLFLVFSHMVYAAKVADTIILSTIRTAVVFMLIEEVVVRGKRY
jgi:hypothetical protein